MSEQPVNDATRDRRSDARYPSDDELVRLMAVLGSYGKVAQAVGVRRESLRDFLKIRPVLKARLEAVATASGPTRRMSDEAKEKARSTHRDYTREYMRQRRLEDPEGMRRVRREQMRTYGSDYHHKWNTYNRLRRQGHAQSPDEESREYVRIIHQDVCVYCNGEVQHVDHIVSISNHGTGHWTNLAPTCQPCNQQKHTKSLLQFLIVRKAAA